MKSCDLVQVIGLPTMRHGKPFWNGYQVLGHGSVAEMADAWANSGGKRDRTIRILLEGEFLGQADIERLIEELG